MDVDQVPLRTAGGSTTLKRSSSAPMINNLAFSQSSSFVRSPVNSRYSAPSLCHLRRSSGGTGANPRTNHRVRRFSANFSPNHPPVSPSSSSGVRTPSRLMQIRHEEGLEEREIRHERNVHAALLMSQSCEDLVLSGDDNETAGKPHLISSLSTGSSSHHHHQFASLTDPLYLNMPSSCNSSSSSSSAFNCLSSPTRTSRLCLSPSLPFTGRVSLSFSPSPSPSPTRHTSISRRSMSPITLRPSPLGAAATGSYKRKWSVCDNDGAVGSLTPKRLNSGSGAFSPTCMLLSPAPVCNRFEMADNLAALTPTAIRVRKQRTSYEYTVTLLDWMGLYEGRTRLRRASTAPQGSLSLDVFIANNKLGRRVAAKSTSASEESVDVDSEMAETVSRDRKCRTRSMLGSTVLAVTDSPPASPDSPPELVLNGCIMDTASGGSVGRRRMNEAQRLLLHSDCHKTRIFTSKLRSVPSRNAAAAAAARAAADVGCASDTTAVNTQCGGLKKPVTAVVPQNGDSTSESSACEDKNSTDMLSDVIHSDADRPNGNNSVDATSVRRRRTNTSANSRLVVNDDNSVSMLDADEHSNNWSLAAHLKRPRRQPKQTLTVDEDPDRVEENDDAPDCSSQSYCRRRVARSARIRASVTSPSRQRPLISDSRTDKLKRTSNSSVGQSTDTNRRQSQSSRAANKKTSPQPCRVNGALTPPEPVPVRRKVGRPRKNPLPTSPVHTSPRNTGRALKRRSSGSGGVVDEGRPAEYGAKDGVHPGGCAVSYAGEFVFSFEKVPSAEPWYGTYSRTDCDFSVVANLDNVSVKPVESIPSAPPPRLPYQMSHEELFSETDASLLVTPRPTSSPTTTTNSGVSEDSPVVDGHESSCSSTVATNTALKHRRLSQLSGAISAADRSVARKSPRCHASTRAAHCSDQLAVVTADSSVQQLQQTAGEINGLLTAASIDPDLQHIVPEFSDESVSQPDCSGVSARRLRRHVSNRAASDGVDSDQQCTVSSLLGSSYCCSEQEHSMSADWLSLLTAPSLSSILSGDDCSQCSSAASDQQRRNRRTVKRRKNLTGWPRKPSHRRINNSSCASHTAT